MSFEKLHLPKRHRFPAPWVHLNHCITTALGSPDPCSPTPRVSQHHRPLDLDLAREHLFIVAVGPVHDTAAIGHIAPATPSHPVSAPGSSLHHDQAKDDSLVRAGSSQDRLFGVLPWRGAAPFALSPTARGSSHGAPPIRGKVSHGTSLANLGPRSPATWGAAVAGPTLLRLAATRGKAPGGVRGPPCQGAPGVGEVFQTAPGLDQPFLL